MGDDLQAVVTGMEGLGPGLDGLEFPQAVNLYPEVVARKSRGARHRGILGQQEHELVIGVDREDQPLSVDRHHVEFCPPEHLAEERGQVGPALLAQQISRDAEGDVVDARGAPEFAFLHFSHRGFS